MTDDELDEYAKRLTSDYYGPNEAPDWGRIYADLTFLREMVESQAEVISVLSMEVRELQRERIEERARILLDMDDSTEH